MGSVVHAARLATMAQLKEPYLPRILVHEKPSRTPLPDLERRQGEPLYRQIYRRFRDAIEQGLLAPGDRVASARSLASELGVARGTVDLAYSQLMGEGYFWPGARPAPWCRRACRPRRGCPGRRRPPWRQRPAWRPCMALTPRAAVPAGHAGAGCLSAQAVAAAGGQEVARPESGRYGLWRSGRLLALRQAIAAYLSVSRGAA